MKNTATTKTPKKKSPGWAVFWGLVFPPSSIFYRPLVGILTLVGFSVLVLIIPESFEQAQSLVLAVYVAAATYTNYAAVQAHNAKLATADTARHE